MLHATRQAERRTVPSGETIVRQGEPVSHFYMVVEGAVNIIIQRNNQEASVARLGPGQFFGEVELLADRQSIASVHAAEGQPVELALLPKNLFHKLIEQSPPTEAEIQHVAEARQAENLSHGERMKV
ncbi:MAG: cyclic nucleotide-binding domain-containing protein [Chloroflexi bacterium]|nr:cyclic nucleotide-binding domain-containing protein [Chloroflexota bacterium]